MGRSSKRLRCVLLLITVTAGLAAVGCESKYRDLDLDHYEYRDTRNLVRFVDDAAAILRRDGRQSLEHFRHNRPLYSDPDHYLYIYDLAGTNLFHAGMPQLEGRDLRAVTDKDGKRIHELILAALADEHNLHAWVHYSWWEPGKFYPVPKSSCHFQIKTPTGEALFVGGGLDYPQEEKEFIRIVVDDAAKLIAARGQPALAEIADPVSQYNYRDVRVFAFRADGEILISPVIDSSLAQLKLLECTDEVGHRPFARALETARSAGTAWEVFMAKNRYQRMLVKKCLYVRRTQLAGDEVFVAAITDLPQPP